MRAKVKCVKIVETESGHEIFFSPVTAGSPENDSFFKYTPGGEIRLATINSNVVKSLVVGAEYYVDFLPVPADG